MAGRSHLANRLRDHDCPRDNRTWSAGGECRRGAMPSPSFFHTGWPLSIRNCRSLTVASQCRGPGTANPVTRWNIVLAPFNTLRYAVPIPKDPFAAGGWNKAHNPEGLTGASVRGTPRPNNVTLKARSVPYLRRACRRSTSMSIQPAARSIVDPDQAAAAEKGALF